MAVALSLNMAGMVWSKPALPLGMSASVETACLIISSLYIVCLQRLWRGLMKVQRTYLLSIVPSPCVLLLPKVPASPSS